MTRLPDEPPHLPFEGGLPEIGPRKRKRKQPAPVTLPGPSRWHLAQRWLRRYVGDVGYGLAVKAGVAVVIVGSSVVVGDQGFDMFGRRSPKTAPKMEMPEAWPIEVKPEAREKGGG